MPYVQRDFDGKIVGLYANPQPQEDGTSLTETDPLPEDHPEVALFRAAHPILDYPAPTLQQLKQLQLAHDELKRDEKKLQNLMLHHFRIWAELETAMSLLLQAILNTPPPRNNLARAMYFSLGGFDARLTMTTKALEQFIHDHVAFDRKSNQQLEMLNALWKRISTEVRTAKLIRNNIAHGQIGSLPHGGKHHARLTTPFFDPIRQGNPLAKGSLPGMGINDLEVALKDLKKLIGFVDRMSEIIQAFYQFGSRTLPETIARLERNLQS